MLRLSRRSFIVCRSNLRLCANAPKGTSSSTVTSSHPTTGAPQVPDLTLDAATIEKLKIADEIGEKAFEENTEILKRMMLRGLRALVIGIFGFVAFSVAMKRRRRLEEDKLPKDESDEDPTQRYLQEMRSLGFDVDTLEEELESEKKSKVSPPK